MPAFSPRIEPLAGYSPSIGRLVAMLDYARATTLAAVDGLTLEQLDHLHDETSNSIGALLSHIAVVERAYQVLSFDARLMSPKEDAAWATALNLGADGRNELRGRSLESYREELASVRSVTLRELSSRRDEWLDESLVVAPAMNNHWAWFHVAEDEINHRGQIRWLRSRLHSTSH